MRGLSVFLLLFATSSTVAALQLESPHRSRNQRCIHERFPLSKRPANRLQPFVVASTSNSEPLNDEELAYLKQELTAYLALRTKVGADERAKE